jgi:hypothetical protein
MVESILVTLFCCLPLGIVAIIKASEVNSKFAAGDYMGAQASSEQAGKFVKFGLFGGLAVIAIYVVLVVLGTAGSLLSNSSGF